jgi:hypothetical protein
MKKIQDKPIYFLTVENLRKIQNRKPIGSFISDLFIRCQYLIICFRLFIPAD